MSAAAELAEALDGKRTGSQWLACCPAHDVREPSLAIREGDNGAPVVHCHAGYSQAAVIAALRERGLWGGARSKVVRLAPKTFRFRRPDDQGGWIWKLDDTRRVLYRLPELVEAEPERWVFVAEGEKDVDALTREGLTATCNPGGAGKWRADYSEALRGRRVCIIADKDTKGREHAEAVRQALEGVAREVRVLELPGKAKDASDWRAAGHSGDELLELVDLPQICGESSGTLEETLAVFRRWLELPDPGVVIATLGAVAANLLEGDPVWLLLVGPPGSGKTETLQALGDLPRVHSAATLTAAALLSGSPKRERAKDASGGLLRLVGERGLIVCKDFGSVLSMHRDARAEVLSAHREVYDGAWTRHLGTDGGRRLHGAGKCGLVGGCTQHIDRHHAVMGAMGERFLLYRMPSTETPEAQATRALEHAGLERRMREELRATARAILGEGPPCDPGATPAAVREWIVRLATLVARRRSSVERDGYSREVELIPDRHP